MYGCALLSNERISNKYLPIKPTELMKVGYKNKKYWQKNPVNLFLLIKPAIDDRLKSILDSISAESNTSACFRSSEKHQCILSYHDSESGVLCNASYHSVTQDVASVLEKNS